MADELDDVGPPKSSGGGVKPRPVAALLAALLMSSGAVIAPSPSSATAGCDTSLVVRAEALRRSQLDSRSAASATPGRDNEAPRPIAQSQWPNWHNWGNWNNWNNWPNWGNWGNWVNV